MGKLILFRPALGRILFAAALLAGGAVSGQPPIAVDLSSQDARRQSVEQLQAQSEAEIAEAETFATKLGMPLRGYTPDGNYFEIMRVEQGMPKYNITENVNAAVSTGADKVRTTFPFSVDGTGVVAGVWDGGSVLSTHQEFDGRVTVKDGAAPHYHATHVGGTIGAAGVNATAKGMAPAALIDSYDWNSDFSEMAGRAATTVQVSPGTEVYFSNHSYGAITGWASGSYSGSAGWHWFGTWGDPEDDGFGQYNYGASQADTIAYNAPYYLIFKSAGNDRGGGPSEGATIYYFSAGSWRSKTYSSATDPPVDGGALGFDSIPTEGNAKNIVTVGAAADAVSNGVRNVPSGTITSFSGFGPADDGRVKPDITGNGHTLFSTDSDNPNDYTTLSGTSMSAPNVSGSAALLIQYYRDRFNGDNMLSSMLKGLIIHTATDAGNAGPDYTYGWGYLDALGAARHIETHANNPAAEAMITGTLNGVNPTRSYTYTWDGVSPFRATLVWTDPAGVPISTLDDPTPALVNDLDLRIIAPNGLTTYFPFLLDGSAPSDPATTGDNVVDNVEQVFIASPSQAGIYTVTVSHKGTLTNSAQVFSLLVSGQAIEVDFAVGGGVFTSERIAGGPFTPDCQTYTVSNLSEATLNWTVSTTTSWLTVSPQSGSLGIGSNADVEVCIGGNAGALADGTYSGILYFTNSGTGQIISKEVRLTIDSSSSIAFFALDTNPGWTTDGQWGFGVPQGVASVYGGADPAAGHTGSNVYGYNLAGDYPNNLTKQYLTTTAIDCSAYAGVTLGFSRWLGVESATWDHASIEVSNDGTNWSLVWDHTGGTLIDTVWTQQTFDISAVADGAGTVYVRWVMGQTDGSVTHSGWNIDDIEFRGVPVALAEAWVDFSFAGVETGSQANPFNTLQEAVEAAVDDGSGRIYLKGDTATTTSSETGQITKPLHLEAINGTVRIGVQ